MFYPDIKPHVSPSAFAQWHRQRSLFVRSYFKGEKSPETAAMRAGKKLHALIEGGFLAVENSFPLKEKEIVFALPNGVKVLGIPDSHDEDDEGAKEDVVSFVDYKTGTENHWTRDELATDLKMLLTARLVLSKSPNVEKVRGIIEWVGTEWNGSELVPTGGEHVCVEQEYSREDLLALDEVVLKTIEEVNVAYEEFLKASDAANLVDDKDVVRYAELEAQKNQLEQKQDEIKERIAGQLEYSGKQNYEHALGSFYFTTRKTYEYPKTLKIGYKDMGLVLEDAEEIASAASAVKKNYELDHEPVKVSKSLGFRAKKK